MPPSPRLTDGAPVLESGRGFRGSGPAAPLTQHPDVDRLVAAARDAAATDAATAAAADRDGGHGATDHLARLLATTPTIEQAKGLLMGSYGADADTAYAMLRYWSSHTNTKLSRIAEQLVTAAAQPSGRPFSGLRTFLATLPSAANPRHDAVEGGHSTAR